MLIASSKELWDDNGYGKDNPFENTVSFLVKEARGVGIEDGIAETVIAEVLLEVAEGRVFSKDKCPCGCGIDKSGTAITHEMLGRIIILGKKVKEDMSKVIISNLNSIILDHIRVQNEEYTSSNMPPKKPFLDWSRSPTVRIIRRMYGLVRSSE